MCKLKHLAVAAAIIGLATHVQAGYFAGSTDFEGADPLSDGLWSDVGESEIVADPSVASVPRAANLPPPPSFNETIRTNVLGVDGDTPIVRDLQANGTAPTAATIYADALVKGYPLAADASAPEAGASDKILVYTRISQDGTDTNLCVLAAASDADSTATEFVLTKSIGKDEWHRIVIKATAEGYQVYCDGVEAAKLCKTSGDVDTFYALNAGAPMKSVAFQGTGYVDDLILSDLDPTNLVHTLVWGDEFDSVSYTVDGVAGESLEGVASPYAFQAPAGSKVILTGDTGYRTFAETNTIGSASMSLALPSVTGIAKYFPQSATAGQDGTAGHPYEIPNLPALKALQAAATETNCFGLCFLQTADIALDAAWPGIGIQNGKDLVSYSLTGNGAITQAEADQRDAAWAAGAFKGSYDGGNFTVSKFQMVGVAGNPANNGEGLDYCGFFNSTYGATICNLKIAYAGSLFAADTTASTKESGATFVGVAKNSTLRNLTTLAGTVSCSKGFGGISGYTTSGTVIDSCTNNLNMTSLANNKCGGIAMITQGGSAVTITNCQNNGTQTTGSSNSEYGAIVGYVGVNTTIADCETTVGRFLKHEGATVTLQGVNKGDATVASYHGAATPGLNFATVDGDVATFVADDALAAGNTYQVMGPSATATYAFTAPGTIAFDEAMYAPTYAITAPGLALTEATDGTVKTYTAALAVAQITGGAKYASLQAAVDAASAGDTVTVLTNCEISTSLSIAKNITVHNDYTIAANVNYAICVGATVAFEGTGKIERGSTIQGSAFCIGANETIRGAITAGTAGALTFDGLTICGGTGGNLIKLENGTVTMNGGVLKDGLRGIKADADAGSYTSAIVINGGTITNCSACAVMASAESATGTATVTINGGVIAGALDAKIGDAKQLGVHTITIPGTSTAKFNADQSAFCESGYETVLSDGWYVVQAVAAQSFNYPEGREITDQGLIDWLSNNGFSQDDIYALGRDAAATDKLYECWLLNCSIKAQNPGGTISITAIAVSNKVSITVQLVRQDPLGFINGVLHIHGTDDLADDFSPISDEIVGFSDGNSIFDTDPAEGAVTQSVTANFSPTDVTAKFFKAVIEFPIADNGNGEGVEEEGGGEE